jgi:hypothetical protein
MAPRRIDSAPREAKIGDMTREAILAEILKLPVREQEELLVSLEELVPVPENAPIPQWHLDELERRLSDPSDQQWLSWDEVRRQLEPPQR